MVAGKYIAEGGWRRPKLLPATKKINSVQLILQA